MKIVCSTNMPFVEEAFSTLGDAVVLEGRNLKPADMRDAELMAVRSTTKVDRALLEGSRVRFVGTATIGTDHMDIPYMEKAGIRWCYAPGCNANSVAEYVTTALLRQAVRHGFTLAGKTVGVIGVGNVGRLVVRQAEALGLRVLQNDPPRERAEEGGNGQSLDIGHQSTEEGRSRQAGRPTRFVSLDRIPAESDVVTFHVPLTKQGPDKTLHMADQAFFARLKPGCLFFNCARGAVVKTDALLAAMDRGVVACAVVDTWEGEPAYRRDLLQRVDIATPHIAGHSFEGKVMGTVMVYREACRFLGVAPAWTHEGRLPPPPVPRVAVDAAGRREEEVLWDIAHRVYDIEADDRRFRAASAEADFEHFDRLRRDYPMRREFRFTTVSLKNASEALTRRVAAIGFQV